MITVLFFNSLLKFIKIVGLIFPRKSIQLSKVKVPYADWCHKSPCSYQGYDDFIKMTVTGVGLISAYNNIICRKRA
jgi:hypothetical protein